MQIVKSTFDITNTTFDQTIKYSEEVRYFTDIQGINPIPTDSIIHKTVTGIGATHSEIVAHRHSIIVLPHIAIIKSKDEHYRNEGINIFAIHGEVTQADIMDYLSTHQDHYKFLVTPKGLVKLIKITQCRSLDYLLSCLGYTVVCLSR